MIKEVIKTADFVKKGSFFVIIFLIILSLVFEILGLGMIIPLISFFSISNFQDWFIYEFFLNNLDFIQNKNDFLIFNLVALVVIFFLRFLLLSFISLKINFFIGDIYRSIGKKLIKIYLSKNYEWHASNNKSKFMSILINEVENFCANSLTGFLYLVAELVIFIGIIFFLLIYKTKFFLFMLLFASIFFPAILIFSKKVNYKLGLKRMKSQESILNTINENLNGIREIVLYNWREKIKNNYFKLTSVLVRVTALQISFQDIIRYLLEFIAVLAIVIFIYFLNLSNLNSETNLVTIGVFAAALFRLMPILNRLSTYFQKLRFGIPAAKKILEFYNLQETKLNETSIDFNQSIKFENISFKFKDAVNYTIKDISFELNKNDVLGIKGESGVGKTTLSNLIMGLIKPTSGKITVDLKQLGDKETISDNFSLVPQNFFYIDDSLFNNITVFSENFSLKKFKFSIKSSMLMKSILDKKISLKTGIGNNAMKISGGQLQRIGIARALYRGSKILILDEPTSSLDEKNQRYFDQIVNQLKEKMTIIIISHNNILLKNCNKIIELK